MKFTTSILTAISVLFLFSCAQTPTVEEKTGSEEIAAEEPELSRLEQEHQLYKPGYADSVNQGLIAEDTFKGSSRRRAEGQVSGVDVTVNYGSPGKRGRVLWNGLVSYDQVWVTGSHWATALTFSKDVDVEGTTVPAGTYGFFTIPGTDEWTLIINKVYDQHLADDYDQAQDVVRVEVAPESLDQVVQRLTYMVEPTGDNTGNLSMAWDQVKVSMPFSVK